MKCMEDHSNTQSAGTSGRPMCVTMLTASVVKVEQRTIINVIEVSIGIDFDSSVELPFLSCTQM
jgi:hypothetical protein